MNRGLQYLNFFGIVALAILCGLQWRVNRLANLDALHLEKIRQEQVEALEAKDKTIKGVTADLDSFREQLTRANTTLKIAEDKLSRLESELQGMTAQRDQLKESVSNWSAAVTARDAQLKTAAEQIHTLADEQNKAVGKFNELAQKYNALVKEVNESRTNTIPARPAQ